MPKSKEVEELVQAFDQMYKYYHGWHFAYEGFYKLMLPGWSRSGQLMAPFSAQGYLRGATGPLAALFHGVAGNASMMHAVDIAVPLALLLVGLSLMLGLFTQSGCAGAIAFLALFYLSQPPLSGMPQTGAEGAYLIVNKNLIELAAVLALLSFRTGWIAGLDRCGWRAPAHLKVRPTAATVRHAFRRRCRAGLQTRRSCRAQLQLRRESRSSRGLHRCPRVTPRISRHTRIRFLFF